MKKIFISAIFYKAKQKMLKILFPFLLAINILSFGQITTTGSGDYTENIDNILSNLDKSPVTTGILYDRVMSFADLDLLREDGYYYFQLSAFFTELERAVPCVIQPYPLKPLAAESKFAKYGRNNEHGYHGHRHSESASGPIKYGLYRYHQYENELY